VSAQTPRPVPGGWKRRLKVAAGVLAATLVLFLLVEGFTSTCLLIYDVAAASADPPAERLHTRYDPLLGWVGEPGVVVRDIYGPGKNLTTNSQGFRSDRDYEVRTPPGKLRVICSGDSFTLGFGVDDADTWCRSLERLDPRLETVNMGQGGYGVDQAFLWYAREGVKLEHQVLLFAFITEDFRRMSRDNFLGFGKPVLAIEGNQIRTTNVPVPRTAYLFPWLGRNAILFRGLRVIQLVDRVTGRGPDRVDPRIAPETWSVAMAVFETLDRMTREKGGVLVLVSLPDTADYSIRKSDGWRAALRSAAGQQGWIFVDLVDEIRRLPPEAARAMYHDHFNEEGNRWVARTIHDRLTQIESVAARLAPLAPPGTPP
jgi:hypothetical protein